MENGLVGDLQTKEKVIRENEGKDELEQNAQLTSREQGPGCTPVRDAGWTTSRQQAVCRRIQFACRVQTMRDLQNVHGRWN